MHRAWLIIFGSSLILIVLLLTLILPPPVTGGSLIVGLSAIASGYIGMLVLILMSNAKSDDDREFAYNTALTICLIYFALQTIAFYIMGAIHIVPFKLVVGIHALMLLLFVVIVLMLGIGTDDTKRQSDSEKNGFISCIRKELALVMSVGDHNSTELCYSLEKIIKASPYQSKQECLQIESSIIDIMHTAYTTQSAEDRNQLLAQAIDLLKQRNKAL